MRILLIGDSILMGYSNGPGYFPFVRAVLESEDTTVTARACSDSGTLADSISETLEGRPWDVIHFNCGLHDLKRDRETGAVIRDQAGYAAYVGAICDELLKTRARLIWATITPVHDEWHRTYKPFDRRQADVVTYNEAALEQVGRRSIEIDDLQAVVCAQGHERLQHTDGVHFTETGSRVLADAVVASIRPVIAESARSRSTQ